MRSISHDTKMLAAVFVSTLACVNTVQAGGVAEWALPISGDWDDAKNWLNNYQPDSTDLAIFGLAGSYEVFVTRITDANSIQILNPDVTLSVQSGSFVRVFADSVNNGLIKVHTDMSEFVRAFRVRGDVTLDGQGTLQLLHPLAKIQADTDQSRFTNGVQHSITGQGTIQGDSRNLGFISATEPSGLEFTHTHDNAGVIVIEPGSTVRMNAGGMNSGQIEIASTGLLDVVGDNLQQADQGAIVFSSPDSVVDLHSNAIIGGYLESVNGGVVLMGPGARLDGVTIQSQISLETEPSTRLLNSLIQNAEIHVESIAPSGQLSIGGTNSFQGVGAIVLNGLANETGSAIDFEPGSVWPAGYTLRGAGRIRPPYINNGVINADVVGESLRLIGEFENNGSVIAQQGGTLRLSSTNVLGDKGLLAAIGTGSKLILEDVVVLNGQSSILQSIDGGEILNTGILRLRDAVLVAPIRSTPGSEIDCEGLVYNSGLLTLDNARMNFREVDKIYGPGSIRLIGPDASLGNVSTTSEQFIEGSGEIAGRSYIAGSVEANDPNLPLYIGGVMENYSTLKAVNGSTLVIQGTVLNQTDGEITADGAGSRLQIGDSSSAPTARITGGSISSTNGAQIDLGDDYTLAGVQINSDIFIGAFYIFELKQGTELNATIDMTPSGNQGAILDISEPAELNGNGKIILSTNVGFQARLTGGSVSDPLDLGEGIELTGLGNIFGDTIIHGVISPGFEVGRLYFVNDLELADTSTYQFQVGGNAADLLEGAGAIEFNGQIVIEYVNGFTPDGYWLEVAAEAAEVSVDHHELISPQPAPGYVARYYNTGTQLFIGHAVIADMNLDGMTDFFDVELFVQYFGMADPIADLNGDGQIDFFDVAMFLSSY